MFFFFLSLFFLSLSFFLTFENKASQCFVLLRIWQQQLFHSFEYNFVFVWICSQPTICWSFFIFIYLYPWEIVKSKSLTPSDDFSTDINFASKWAGTHFQKNIAPLIPEICFYDCVCVFEPRENSDQWVDCRL